MIRVMKVAPTKNSFPYNVQEPFQAQYWLYRSSDKSGPMANLLVANRHGNTGSCPVFQVS